MTDAELRPVHCQVCGIQLFRAAGRGTVEIVCPRHRAAGRRARPDHGQKQRFDLGAPRPAPKRA